MRLSAVPIGFLPPLPTAVLLAALLVHRLPWLASQRVSAILLAAGLLGLFLARERESRTRSCARSRAPGGTNREALLALVRFAALLLASGAWTMFRAEQALALRIVPDQEGIEFIVQGHVAGMPQAVERGDRFVFHIERCVGPAAGLPASPACPQGRDVRLGWYRDFHRPASGRGVPETGGSLAAPGSRGKGLQPGQRWQLTVRLKRPHALLNSGAFDAELRALEEGVAATGHVRASRDPDWPNRRLAGRSWRPGPVIEALRTSLRDAILAALATQRADAAGVVAALSIGDQAAIPGGWWEIFNRTGVGHLMSISGLHITMLAAMAGSFARRLLRHPAIGRRGLLERCPAGGLKWAFALTVAFAYSALAGWGIPAQRTCWMLAVAGFALHGGRSRSLARVLALSAAVVTVLDPWAPLSAGFWLSFASVSAIVWYGSQERMQDAEQACGAQGVSGSSKAPVAFGRRQAKAVAILADAVRTQWAATLSLLPLGALFFSSFSLVGPLANAFAIPLVSIVITPLALLGTGLLLPFPSAGAWLLGAVCTATGWLLDVLTPLAAPRLAIAVLASPGWPATVAASLGIAALLAPFRLPGRPAAFAALLPLFAQFDSRPAPGTLVVTALDVGQGSAILIETPSGRLLFDAGPRYGADSEAGARVLVPWLRSRGIGRLEAMVVSHADEDHAGGSTSVLAGMQVDWVASPLPDEHPALTGAAERHRCWRGDRWRWGEAEFEFLHPGPERTARKSPTNATSCVLRVESPAGVVLLTGDIEAAQERFLVEKLDSRWLRADVLVAPHHGSNGSSTLPFLRAVSPAYAIAQAGYRNRFGHPGDKTRARYRAAGIALLRTDRDGAISITLRGPGEAPQVARLRQDDRRYWRIRLAPDP